MGHTIKIGRDENGYWQVWVDDKRLDRVTLHLDADMLEVDGTNAITYNLNER